VQDTAFEGERALAEFDALVGAEYADARVPVENTGGQGVANGHWRESVFGNELMSPFMSRLDGVLSRVTIASLEDIGYEVSYDAAGDYVWPPPDEPVPGGGQFPFGPAGVDTPTIDLSNDALDIPVYAVGPDGEMVRL
jgi:hypothetical protein